MSICAVSTSWRSGLICDAKDLIDTMKETGINILELEFRINDEVLKEIKKNYTKWGVKIASLHSVCPSPPGRKRGAEHYFISDEDEKNRTHGVTHVKQTLRNAAEIGAHAVIVHCGQVPIPDQTEKMKQLFDTGKINSEEANKTLNEISNERMANRGKSFQALLKSLNEINAEAEILNIHVGLENRYYFNEYPNMEELKIIFSHFNGSKIGYWHDTGHSHVNEILFRVPQKLMLETFKSQLIGVHLHDVVNGHFDHNEPGSGMVDFEMVKSYLHSDTIRVMEISHRLGMADAKRGIEYLKEKGLFAE